jgi:hypothetical protein
MLIVVGLLALGGSAFAELCTVDAVPAATLLVPYFEVDLDAVNGTTTLFSINNASAAPTIAHVIFWTDWSYPTIDFDIYLTGYDVVTVNVRDVFNGNIPLTSDANNDPFQADTFDGRTDPSVATSPAGGGFCDGIRVPGNSCTYDGQCDSDNCVFNSLNPHWDTNLRVGTPGFPNCDLIFPNFTNPVISGAALTRLVNGHTGGVVPSPVNNCVGDDHGDNVARGYITIDNASECSLVLDPADVGLTGTPYFISGGTGVANNINQLWGDWFLVDPANAFAQGDTLVHIEAYGNGLAPTPPPTNLTALNVPLINLTSLAPDNSTAVANVASTTGYTFYGRYFTPADGRDNREPLGTVWGSRYLNGGVFDQTQFIVWRDSTADDISPDNDQDQCGGVGPSWFPLNETEVIAFNEAEDAVEICFFTGGFVSPPQDEDPPCFPWETHRYNWGDAPLDVPYNFGWAWLNLNLPPDAPVGDHDFGSDGNLSQSYVTTIHSALGLFSVGLQAIELYDACQDFNSDLDDALQNGGMNNIPFF